MAVAVINEPYEKLRELIERQDVLLAILKQYGRGMSVDRGPWPILTWDIRAEGMGGVDTERTGYHRDAVKFDLFWSDDDGLRDLASLVDAMDEAHLGGDLDCEHWRVKQFTRVSDWRRLEWRSLQDETGNNLVQITSDWLLVYLRRP